MLKVKFLKMDFLEIFVFFQILFERFLMFNLMINCSRHKFCKLVVRNAKCNKMVVRLLLHIKLSQFICVQAAGIDMRNMIIRNR